MKKRLLIGIAASIMMALPVHADEAELLARIEALELRVAQLEALLGAGDVSSEVQQDISAGEAIELETGTWIVGEDIPAGKYDMTCTSGAGSVYFYNSYEEMKTEKYSFTETYYMGSEAQRIRFKDSEEKYYSIFTRIVNNIRLEDGNCVNSEAPAILLTPVE